MKVLMVGDIMGSAGRTVFSRVVSDMKSSGRCDLVVANAENAAGGKGLTRQTAGELLSAGADVLTLGDHVWDQKDLEETLGEEPRVLRPANFSPECPGIGFVTVDTQRGPLTVINLIGRVFMKPADCPFRAADIVLRAAESLGKVILVDFHAEATSEKAALGQYLDGRVSAIVGTHSHVQTSDERILPKGTAFMTDLGMTGPKDSIIGCVTENVLSHFLTGMKAKFIVEKDPESALLEGLLMDIDELTGKVQTMERIRE